MMKSDNTKDYTLKVFCGGLLSSWILWIFGVGLLLGLLLWVAALVYLFSEKSWLKWYLFFLSGWIVIPTFHVLGATRDYLNGNATFNQKLSLKQKFYNLDPTYRVWKRNSGVFFDGFELLENIPNNLTVKALIKLFGYQKDAYLGFYPDSLESKRLLARYGKPIQLKMVDDSLSFNVNQKPFKMPQAYLTYFPSLSESTEILVCLVQNELILIQTKNSKNIYLMDAKTTNIFACYLQSPNTY